MLTYFWLLNKEIKEDHREPLLIALRLKKKKKKADFCGHIWSLHESSSTKN